MKKNNKKLIKYKAFTLVELLAVIFIIGIISVITLPTIEKATKESREQLYQVQLKNIITGAKNWSTKNVSVLPEEEGETITLTLAQLKIGGFIDKNIKDPRNKKTFPNDLEITITKKSNNYEYIVLEDSGGTNDNIDYNSPSIILNGQVHETLEIHTEYIEKGVVARDPSGAEIDLVDITIRSNNIVVESVDTSLFRQYKITYSVNYNGTTSSAIRTVTVKDTIPPTLSIPSNAEIFVDEVPAFDVMAGVVANDNSLKSVTIKTSGTLSQLPGDYYIKYIATDESGNETTKTRRISVSTKNIYKDIVGALSPNLEDGMIPITWDGTKWIKADLYKEWFNYSKKEWANVVLVTEETRDYYMSSEPGIVIKENDVLAYLVWIPRYRYQLFNVGTLLKPVQTIEISFEANASDKATGSTDGSWLTHPAFTFGDKELEGFWVGKFETSGFAESPTVKPNLPSLTKRMVASMFFSSLHFNKPIYISDTATINFHMMTNQQWGAVTYLTQSIYGKNSEVWINPSNDLTTGCAGTNASSSATFGCLYDYTTSNGKQASTTGNIYGIYDMSGGAAEFVMGAMKTSDDKAVVISGAGFGFREIDSELMNKYLTKYSYGTTNVDQTAYNRRILGDSTGETRGWNSDSSQFIASTSSWFIRGGLYNSTTAAGLFGFSASTGAESENYGFRLVGVNSIFDNKDFPDPCYDTLLKKWVC